jgi:hypothetical protein
MKTVRLLADDHFEWREDRRRYRRSPSLAYSIFVSMAVEGEGVAGGMRFAGERLDTRLAGE